MEGFKKGLTAKQAEAFIDELNKKAAETTKPAPKDENKPGEQPKVESSNGDALVQDELPEFTGGVNGVEAAVNEVPEYTFSQSGNTSTGTQASARQTAQTANAQAQEAPSTKNPVGINSRTSANSAQAATEEKTAVAQAELPNTGSAEFAVFTPAVLSILAGLGLVAPKGKKEDK